MTSCFELQEMLCLSHTVFSSKNLYKTDQIWLQVIDFQPLSFTNTSRDDAQQ